MNAQSQGKIDPEELLYCELIGTEISIIIHSFKLYTVLCENKVLLCTMHRGDAKKASTGDGGGHASLFD
jgi:hypothetical protein